MEVIGIDWALLVTQIINVLILVGWVVLAIVALRRLRRPELDHFERALWTLAILVLPLMGVLTFWLFRISHGRQFCYRHIWGNSFFVLDVGGMQSANSRHHAKSQRADILYGKIRSQVDVTCNTHK